MQTSPLGFSFIKHNEGFQPTVMPDNGHFAIGYGHDLKAGETFTSGVTEDVAEQLLKRDVLQVESILQHLVPASCTQNQWDALVDFGFNLGTAALQTMLAHGWEQVTTQIPRWDKEHVNGEVVENAGLKARREAEVKLFSMA